VDYETSVSLISRTSSQPGLSVKCRLDRRKYKPGIKVTDDEFSRLNIECKKFHGEWNYVLYPDKM
jgi:hypothetical protein